MKIDLRGGSNRQDGFGVAGRTIYKTLEDLGHEIDPDADIQLVFTHPHNFVHDASYNIGYFPWESTEPQLGWRRNMKKMDEIWVTSPLMVPYVQEWGFDPYVYQHGLNSDWKPRVRRSEGKIKFLHQGLEAFRKGGKDTLSAFSAAFQGIDDVELTMKSSVQSMAFSFGKVSTNTEILPKQGLLDLYYDHHVFVAPSYGEGFGLPALDAMGTGMPVVLTQDVFPHQEFLPQTSLVKSKVIDSQWIEHHPGQMWQPDFDDLVDRLRFMYETYDERAIEALEISEIVHEEATWSKRTEKVFNDLALRINQ